MAHIDANLSIRKRGEKLTLDCPKPNFKNLFLDNI